MAVLFVAACSRDPAPRTTSPDAATAMTPAPPRSSVPPIGVARMRPDGTLELDLRGPGGAEARTVYPPSHAEYNQVLAHLGGMKPGEEKPVPPWPDPWDAARVETAAHAHAAKKGWSRDEYRVEIMGTDADGNAVVTLSHADDKRSPRPGGRKSVSLRVDPKTYAVVKELAFQ
jgi:hypothetical protein